MRRSPRCLPALRPWSVVLLSLGLAAGAAAAERLIELREAPLLLVDDTALAVQRGVGRTLHPARTRREPVLRPERPWEGERVYTYGSIHYDASARIFRLWYMSRTQRPDGVKPAPDLRGGGMDIVLLAHSTDGVRWDRPVLGLHAYDGSKANNIVFDVHSPAVVHDRREPDPAKRYKLLGYFKGDYYAAHSPDGIHWTLFPQNPVFKASDTMSLTQEPNSGEFLAYYKQISPEIPGRLVWLRRSRDLQAWSEPKLVFRADAEDNRWSRQPDQYTEVYNMAVRPHAGGFLGFPTMFQVTARAEKGARLALGQSGNDGPIDVQLVTSADGENWQRTSPRLAIIPRGAPGTFDGGAILGVTSTTVDVGDETWMYYTAINTGHGAPLPTKQLTIGRAEWRRHGFASLDAGPAGGRIETHPLRIAGGMLVLNADASRGELRAGLTEADGSPLAGFGPGDAEPLRGDATRAVVRWKGGKVPDDRPVRVVLEMTNVRLFSLAGSATLTPP